MARGPGLERGQGDLGNVGGSLGAEGTADVAAGVDGADGGAVPVVLGVGDELDRVGAGPQADGDGEVPELIPVEGVGEVAVERGAAVDADVGRGGHQVRVVVVGDDALVVGVADGHAVGAGRCRPDRERQGVGGPAANAGDNAAV